MLVQQISLPVNAQINTLNLLQRQSLNHGGASVTGEKDTIRCFAQGDFDLFRKQENISLQRVQIQDPIISIADPESVGTETIMQDVSSTPTIELISTLNSSQFITATSPADQIITEEQLCATATVNVIVSASSGYVAFAISSCDALNASTSPDDFSEPSVGKSSWYICCCRGIHPG